MNAFALSRPGAGHLVAALIACPLLLGAGPSLAANGPQPEATLANPAANPVIAGDLQVAGAWARATVASTPVAAVYFTITNRGQQADTLLGASTTAASAAMFHRTVQVNGMARMQPAGEVPVAPGQVLKVAPGGLHLMLHGLKQPLAAGMQVPLLLKFQRAGQVCVQVAVVPLTAVAPGSGAAQGSMPRKHPAHGAAP